MDLNSTSPSALKWTHVEGFAESPDSDYGTVKHGTEKYRTVRWHDTARYSKVK